jgi:hypothetical protein
MYTAAAVAVGALYGPLHNAVLRKCQSLLLLLLLLLY